MSESNKDWAIYLHDPDVVLTCKKCRKYRTYTNPWTGYRYRWCKYCMKQHVLGPYKHVRLGEYTPEQYQMKRKRLGLPYKE